MVGSKAVGFLSHNSGRSRAARFYWERSKVPSNRFLIEPYLSFSVFFRKTKIRLMPVSRSKAATT